MGKTYISVKKLQLIPLGDKEELNRVYTYLKDGKIFLDAYHPASRKRNYINSIINAVKNLNEKVLS